MLLLALAGTCAPGASVAQEKPSETGRKIFVDIFQGKLGSAQLRDEVLARLRDSHEVKIVNTPAEADLVVHGNGEVWVKGRVAANPHTAAGNRELVYGGFLSLNLETPAGEVLWSYMVTPGRMHWGTADQDMSDHIARLLLAALLQPLQPGQTSSPSAAQIALTGAGSTFSAPLYQAWIQSFEVRRPEVRTTYQAVGSEEGIRLLEAGKVDFAGSDVPLSDEQLAAAPVKLEEYATVLGGVVPAYNLPGVGRDLEFTPEILARIYLGKIVRWNDPALRALNHGASLPDRPIVVLHRSDGSGTTFAWTDFLSRTNPEWKAAVGSGMRVTWPAGEGVAGNEGVAARIAEAPGAIGYVELTYAIRHELSYGLVKNAAGRFVQANLTTLSDAAAAVSSMGDLRAPFVNAAGKDAYPIATLTWILLPVSGGSAEKSAALHDLLRWMLTTGQRECAGLGYVPLPKDLAGRELAQMHPSELNAPSGR